MSQPRIPPPQRSGHQRSDSTVLRRTAINTSHLQSLELTFNDPEIEKYCKYLPHETFEWSLADHMKKLSREVSHTTPWTHNASVKWTDSDEQARGVKIVIESKCETGPIVTEAPYFRSPVETLEEHMQYDAGTKDWLNKHWYPEWEAAADHLVEMMSEHGIEEPFTSTSKIRGCVKFTSGQHTSRDDPLSV